MEVFFVLFVSMDIFKYGEWMTFLFQFPHSNMGLLFVFFEKGKQKHVSLVAVLDFDEHPIHLDYCFTLSPNEETAAFRILHSWTL